MTQCAPEILAVSVVLMIWAVWSLSRVVKVLAGLGMVLLVVNEIHMTPAVFLPALALVLAGNAWGWASNRRGARGGLLKRGYRRNMRGASITSVATARR